MTALCTTSESRMNTGVQRTECAGCVRQAEVMPQSAVSLLNSIKYIIAFKQRGPGGERFSPY
jgi:hypothetical protein